MENFWAIWRASYAIHHQIKRHEALLLLVWLVGDGLVNKIE
jgi:hypothetical protein